MEGGDAIWVQVVRVHRVAQLACAEDSRKLGAENCAHPQVIYL